MKNDLIEIIRNSSVKKINRAFRKIFYSIDTGSRTMMLSFDKNIAKLVSGGSVFNFTDKNEIEDIHTEILLKLDKNVASVPETVTIEEIKLEIDSNQ